MYVRDTSTQAPRSDMHKENDHTKSFKCGARPRHMFEMQFEVLFGAGRDGKRRARRIFERWFHIFCGAGRDGTGSGRFCGFGCRVLGLGPPSEHWCGVVEGRRWKDKFRKGRFRVRDFGWVTCFFGRC